MKRMRRRTRASGKEKKSMVEGNYDQLGVASQGVEHMLQSAYGKLDPRYLQTRRAIIESLVRLLTAQPLENISIRDITFNADIGYATFYRHYSSREDLFNEVVSSQVFELIENVVPLVFSSGIRQSIYHMCQRVRDNRELWQSILMGGACGMFRTEFARQIRNVTRRYDGFNIAIPEDLYLACMSGMTVDILIWWLQQADMYSLDEVVDLLYAMILGMTDTEYPIINPESSAEQFQIRSEKDNIA